MAIATTYNDRGREKIVRFHWPSRASCPIVYRSSTKWASPAVSTRKLDTVTRISYRPSAVEPDDVPERRRYRTRPNGRRRRRRRLPAKVTESFSRKTAWTAVAVNRRRFRRNVRSRLSVGSGRSTVELKQWTESITEEKDEKQKKNVLLGVYFVCEQMEKNRVSYPPAR